MPDHGRERTAVQSPSQLDLVLDGIAIDVAQQHRDHGSCQRQGRCAGILGQLKAEDRAGVPDAVSLTAIVEQALEDPPEAQEARERALELVYAHRTGAAERAAKVLLDWAKDTTETTSEDDDVAPVGAPVGPRGADADVVASVPASDTAEPVGATP